MKCNAYIAYMLIRIGDSMSLIVAHLNVIKYS